MSLPFDRITAADEGRHEPGPEELWGESWYFDFFAPDGSIGGWVRLGLYPNLGVSWYHAIVCGPDRRTVSVTDCAAPLPCAPGLELRAPGLWADHVCETALDHWTVANEAHGVAVDAPADLYVAEPRGDIVPIALDLEWETDGDPYPYVHTTRYEVPCRVHGEVLMGDERWDLDGWGQRDHSWGVRDWWVISWVWTAGRLADGTRFHGSDIRVPDVDIGFGYVQPGVPATNAVNASEDLGDHGLPVAGRVDIGGVVLGIEPLAFAPALLVSQDGSRISRFPRALCRFTSDRGEGLGWTEWNQPEGQQPVT